MKKRIKDYNINIGSMQTGIKNSITDVPGVTVGHVTLDKAPAKTGVTAIMPCSDNIFQSKMPCGVEVFNGFGKTAGLVQIEELGTLETPIILTNTLSVGDASRGLVEYLLNQNPDIGVTTGTVNPIIGECNDGHLNDIRGLHVKAEHVKEALANCTELFEEGAVGAGTGMSAYKLKGGIGSASRVMSIEGDCYTIGGLVLSNMGKKNDFVLNGRALGEKLIALDSSENNLPDKGSIIMIIATDAPLSSRQLKRISKRCIVGLSRTGSNMSNGSGEIAISFSTQNRVPHYPKGLNTFTFLHDDSLDLLFEAVGEVIEEAVLNSMITAKTVTGRADHTRYSLACYIDQLLEG